MYLHITFVYFFNYREGSVIVDYDVTFSGNEAVTSQELDDVVKNASPSGTLGVLTIDRNSISHTGKYDVTHVNMYTTCEISHINRQTCNISHM